MNKKNLTDIMSKSFVARQSYFFPKAQPEKVFRAMTEPNALTKWFLSKAEVEPIQGGTFSFDWIGGYHMTSKLKRFKKNKAVSFAWIDRLQNGKIAKTTASFEIAKKGQGTLLKLRIRGSKTQNILRTVHQDGHTT